MEVIFNNNNLGEMISPTSPPATFAHAMFELNEDAQAKISLCVPRRFTDCANQHSSCRKHGSLRHDGDVFCKAYRKHCRSYDWDFEGCCKKSNSVASFRPYHRCPSVTVWLSGLRRWLKAPFHKGVASNPTADNFAVELCCCGGVAAKFR